MEPRRILLFLTTLHWIFAAPGPVRNLSAILERSSGEVLLTWLPPVSGDSEVTQYIIRYWKAGLGDCVDLVIPGPVFTQFVNNRITSKRLGVSWHYFRHALKILLSHLVSSRVRYFETMEMSDEHKETNLSNLATSLIKLCVFYV